jgi:hypothetical protein
VTFTDPPIEGDRLDPETERTIERVRRQAFPAFGLAP